MSYGKPPSARLATSLVAALLIVSDVALAEPPPRIEPQVTLEVRRGRARVIVEVRAPHEIRREGDLGRDQDRIVQRAAIAAAQDAVLSRLARTDVVLLRRFTVQPFLVLEIGPTALAALEKMGDTVSRVVVDTVARPDRAP